MNNSIPMDQFCTNCVCHITPLSLTHRKCGCTCHRFEAIPANNEGRNSKRRRLNEPSLPPPLAVALEMRRDVATSTGYPQMKSYANVDTNNLLHTPCIHPSSDQSTSQTYLSVNETYTVQQGPSRSRCRGPTSTAYIESSYTLSPRSQETILSAGGQRGSTSPGQELEAENSLAGLNNLDFGLNFNRESSGNEFGSNLSPYVATDLWGTSLLIAAPGTGKASLNSYGAGTQQNEDPVLLTQTSQTRLTRQSDEPWAYHPSFVSGKGNILQGETSTTIERSLKNSITHVQHSVGQQVISPSTNEAEVSSNLRWNNTFAKFGSLTQQKPEKLAGRPGCRRGPLKSESKQHATAVRQVGACYRCRFEKLRCSPLGIPCERCKNSPMSPTSGRVCFRKRLWDYTQDLSPDLVFKRLQKDAIELLIKRNSLGYTNNIIEIEISSGPYPPINLTVHEFRPQNLEFLSMKYVGTNDTGGKCHKFTESFAPPLGLDGDDLVDLKKKCIAHVKSIIEQERDIGEATKGDTSMLSWEVFEAINHYRRSNYHERQSPLRDAVILHATFYFMSRIITFTKASATMAVSRLRGPKMLDYLPVLTSQLINLQVKQAMYGWLVDMISKVLEGFDAALAPGPRRKDTWVDHFCIALILCICIEAVQIASDSYVIADLRKDPTSPLSRASTCRQLDDGAYTHFTGLFHTFYKTQKKFKQHGDKGGINPIRDGLKANASDGVTPQMVNLVDEIKEIMKRHSKDIAQRARNPSFESVPHLLTHHMAFRKKNSGRLLSKFLTSFT